MVSTGSLASLVVDVVSGNRRHKEGDFIYYDLFIAKEWQGWVKSHIANIKTLCRKRRGREAEGGEVQWEESAN